MKITFSQSRKRRQERIANFIELLQLSLITGVAVACVLLFAYGLNL